MLNILSFIVSFFFFFSFYFWLYVFSFFVKLKESICMWAYCWVFFSIPFTGLSIYVPIHFFLFCFCQYYSVVQLNVWYGNSTRSSFLVKNCFLLSCAFCFSMWNWELLFECLWRTVLESWWSLEHGWSLNILRSSSIAFM